MRRGPRWPRHPPWSPPSRPRWARRCEAGTSPARELIGQTIAERLIAKGLKKAVFDRNGFLYHGRVKAVAESARKAGLEF